MKIKIFHENGEFKGVFWPNAEKYANATEEEILALKVPEAFKDYTQKVIDSSELEAIEGFQGHEYTEQFFIEENKIYLDVNKERGLMPVKLIKQKFIKNLQDKINIELEKESPDMDVINLNQSKIQICQNWDDKKWYEQALKNLDKKVENGEGDKPIIREKLQSKIL